jgi:hypothetical protein
LIVRERENHLSSKGWPGFSQANRLFAEAQEPVLPKYHPRKPVSGKASARSYQNCCTNSGHSPVDALHSVENTPVTNATFSLTLKTEGVETYSFFDSF